MNEEEALLAAVRDNPIDDNRRLAYADWLDEHDRGPQAAWIRAQVNLGACIPGRLGYPGDEELEGLRAEATQANANFDRQVLIDESIAGLNPRFDRGFVNGIGVEISECRERLPAALARHPIEYVDLNQGGDAVIVFRIRRGGKQANNLLDLAIASGTDAELQDGEWSVGHDPTDTFIVEPVVRKWPDRAAMVAGICDWMLAEVEGR